jgi:thiol-disulfide isomerase/thioredoxin
MTGPEPTASPTPSKAASPRWIKLIVGAVVVGALIGLAGVYGIGGLGGNAGDPACRPATELAKTLTPLIQGEVAALMPARAGLRVPDLAFQDASGQTHRLSDWRGKTVLLNLWATWCVPCRQEMPALDALQKKLGGDGFQVVAINIDTNNPERPKHWLTEAGVSTLSYFSDTRARVFQELKAIGRAAGMPTSMLIDPAGCEIATMAGPADWASADARALLVAAAGK